MKRIISLFLLLINNSIFPAKYAVFIPKGSKEDFNLFIYCINNSGNQDDSFYSFRKTKRFLYLRDFDFFIEGGGRKNGRRALFSKIYDYKKIFVFENKGKFCSYLAYKEYKSKYDEYNRLLIMYDRELYFANKSRKSYIVSLEKDLDTLRKKRNWFEKKLKEVEVNFIFLNLDVKKVVFIPKDFKLLPYGLEASESFFSKNTFIENSDSFFLLERFINKKFNTVINFFYQEKCGDFAGRRKLFNDVKNEPYRYKIFCFENKNKFIRKCPEFLLNTFEIEFCDNYEL